MSHGTNSTQKTMKTNNMTMGKGSTGQMVSIGLGFIFGNVTSKVNQNS